MRSGLPASIRAVILAAEALGVPRGRLLAAVGMPWDALASYQLRVPYAAAAALWAEIERASADPLIGVRIGREIIAQGGAALFQYMLRTAPTIGEGWNQLAPLLGLLFGDGYELVSRDGELGYRIPIHVEPPIERSEECVVIGFVEQARAVAPDFAPTELCFQHAGDADAMRRAVGIAVRFEQPFYGVRITPRALAARVHGHDPNLGQLIAALAQPLVLAPPPPPGPADGAVAVIRELLDRRRPVTVAAVAKALHVSSRTLQRQLAASGTSVRAEADRARHETALRLLRESRYTVAEIADRLGFADPSQFTRAVKRWTGAPPTQLRRHRS